MLISINHLRTFAILAQEKNFSKTARRIHRSQSAVSIQIKELESQMKVQLFDRVNSRNVQLSADGAVLVEAIGSLVSDFDSLLDRFNDLKGQSGSGLIRVGAHEPIITYTLPDVITKYKSLHPDVEIQILRKERPDIIAGVSSGDLTLGITSVKGRLPKNVEYRSVRKYKRLLVTSKQHPLSRLRKKASLQDIAQYPFLLSPESASTRASIEDIFRKENLEYRMALEVTGVESVKKYIEMGFGISILNESLLEEKDSKRFHIVDVANYFGSTERGIMTRRSTYRPSYQNIFIDLTIARMLLH